MNKLSLLAIIALSIIATSTLVYAAGTSPVYSVPELSTMIDSLTLRVSTLETQLTNEKTKETQDVSTLQTEYDDLRQYVIPDYTKSPILTAFNAIYISAPHHEVISANFTIQAFYDGGTTQASCLYEQFATPMIVIPLQLGLHEYTGSCYYSEGASGNVIIMFTKNLKAQYTVLMNP